MFVSFCSFLDSYHIIRQLSRWLWSKTLQRELDAFMAKRNGQKMRKDNAKASPSNCSRNNAFTMPESHALDNKLLPLDDDQLKIVSELKTAVGGAKLLDFVPPVDSVQFEVAVYFTLLHLFQVDSTGVQVDWWSPPGVHLECT